MISADHIIRMHDAAEAGEVTIRILLFARPRELVGAPSVDVRVPSEGVTVAQLRAALARLLPVLAPLLPTCFLAVNEVYAAEDALVRARDDVALIPPVSGG
jgi:molybdopterin converting factor subunit 1